MTTSHKTGAIHLQQCRKSNPIYGIIKEKFHPLSRKLPSFLPYVFHVSFSDLTILGIFYEPLLSLGQPKSPKQPLFSQPAKIKLRFSIWMKTSHRCYSLLGGDSSAWFVVDRPLLAQREGWMGHAKDGHPALSSIHGHTISYFPCPTPICK